MSRYSLLDFYREIVNSEKSFGIDYKNLSKELIERIDKALKLLEELLSDTKGVLNDYCLSRETREHNKILIELLREDEQAYIKLLEILGDKENEKD